MQWKTSIEEFNLFRKYIHIDTIVPLNVYETATEVLNFVPYGPFSRRSDCSLVALDISNGATSDSLQACVEHFCSSDSLVSD